MLRKFRVAILTNVYGIICNRMERIKIYGLPAYRNWRFWLFIALPIFLISLLIGITYSFLVVKDFYQSSGTFVMTDSMTSLYESDLDAVLKSQALAEKVADELNEKRIYHANGEFITSEEIKNGITTNYTKNSSYFLTNFKAEDSTIVIATVKIIMPTALELASADIEGIQSFITRIDYSDEVVAVENYRYQYLASFAVFGFFLPFVIYSFLPTRSSEVPNNL